MLRNNGKFLYVITGSHIDFASHVASHAIGPDWKDLFDIIIFFARKPSFFVENRLESAAVAVAVTRQPIKSFMQRNLPILSPNLVQFNLL